MSYVSGFMMGAAIGKSIRQMFGGSSTALHPAVLRGAAQLGGRQAAGGALEAVPSFALVSALPGRRRYRASRIAPSIAALLEERLGALDFVKSCEVSAVSGSILIEFDEADSLRVDALAAWLKEHLFPTARPMLRRRSAPDSTSRMPAGSHAACATRAGSSRPGSTVIRLAGSI